MPTVTADRRDLMLALAQSPAPGDRDRLLLSLADLCVRGEAGRDPATEALLGDIFMSLIGRVERDIRQRLAEKLAPSAWAPHALMFVLAQDEIEIARPVIAASAMLEDQDLVRILVEAAVEHRMEVARRPHLSAAVTNVILDQAAPEVLAALAGNATAEVTPLGMERLVSFSQTMAGLRAPLSRNPSLPMQLGAMLYTWVGDTLRQALSERFAVDGEAFQTAIAEAVSEARGAPGDGVSLESDERAAMDRRVVDKLKAGDQLRPGLLMRALRDGKLTLFTLALARLGDFTTDQVRQAMEDTTPDRLAMACVAVGVDRSVLPTLFQHVRKLNRGLPGDATQVSSLARITTLMDSEAARRAFCKATPEI